MNVKELQKLLATCDPEWEVQVDVGYGLQYWLINDLYINHDVHGAVETIVFIVGGD